MKKNLLIQYLGNMDRKAVTRFCDFAHSPYFNKHRDVQNLVSYLSQIYPDFNDKKCDREAIFQQLYPALPHDQAKLAIVFTYTTRLLEQFFIIEQAGFEEILEEETLLKKYLRRHQLLFYLEKKWPENAGREKKHAGNTPIEKAGTEALSSHHFEKKYKLAAENDATSIGLSQPSAQFLWEKQAWLDAFYLTEKLRDACEISHRKKLLKTDLPTDILLTVLYKSINDNLAIYQPYPPLLAYFYLYQLLESDGAIYQDTLLKINGLEPCLIKDDVQYIYNSLQNFCIGQINEGRQVFLRELFGIYQSQLKKGLLLEHGKLPEWHYKNITTTGLRLDERQWVRDFLDEYKSMLPDEAIQNAYTYNLATYHYHKKDYDAVLKLLTKIEYTDIRYNLDAKSLLLRTYYDLEEEEPLLALTESFKQYLKRHRQLSDFQKKGYFNLLKFARKAFSLKQKADFTPPAKWAAELEKLKLEISQADTIFNQGWLEGKVRELV